jgi:hypothetical protein
VGAVPVVEDGRLLGLVTSAVLADVLTRSPVPAAPDTTVAALPLIGALALPSGLTPKEALLLFQANDIEQAPVLDLHGQLMGMVSKSELVSAVFGRVRPPLIGGMATPFGVYLTGGGVRGGVGDLALMSTGAYLTVLNILAFWLTFKLIGAGGWIQAVPALADWVARTPEFFVGTSFVVFGALFRLSWVTGYHAAEHQVVHAIEAGDDLRPNVVRQKPRVHPRCGTNLVVAVLIMTAFWESRDNPSLSWIAGMGPVPAMLITVFFWRRIGGWVQQYVTTRPASLAQLESGITAGKQLMERYQQGPAPERGRLGRIWNMGILQVLAGSFLAWGVLWLLQLVLPFPQELRVF